MTRCCLVNMIWYVKFGVDPLATPPPPLNSNENSKLLPQVYFLILGTCCQKTN
jgi:hypothetical protein